MLVRLYTSVYIYSVWLIRIRLFFPLPGWCKSSWNVGNGIVRQHHITQRILSSLSLSPLACGDDDDEEDMNYIGLYNSLSFYFSSFSSSSCSSAFLLLYCTVLCWAAVLAVVVPSRHVQNSMPSRPPSNQLASHEPNITFEKESQGIAPCSSSTAPNSHTTAQQQKRKCLDVFFLPSVVVVVLFALPILLYNIRHITTSSFFVAPPHFYIKATSILSGLSISCYVVGYFVCACRVFFLWVHLFISLQPIVGPSQASAFSSPFWRE